MPEIRWSYLSCYKTDTDQTDGWESLLVQKNSMILVESMTLIKSFVK